MKKLRKKVISFLCVATLTGSLAGCGNTPAADNTNTDIGTSVSASYTINADTSALNESSAISDILYGLFLEDINFAVDGGLYAELVKNRSFEYGSQASNAERHGWKNNNAKTLTFTVENGTEDNSYLNEVNPHYAVLNNISESYAGIGNFGYLDGLAVKAGDAYNISFYAKALESYNGQIRISLQGTDGTLYAESFVEGITNEWHKYETTLTPSQTVNKDLLLYVEITGGKLAFDMISMMPADTYEGLPFRKDLVQLLADLNPSFLRFPGGCVIEGRSLETMYSWKDSIGNAVEFEINGKKTVGDVAVRPQGEDIWRGNNANPYYTTYGIGFYEYFLLCEALDALPVPVLNAGMTCEVQSPRYIVHPLNSEEFKQAVQDALDLVEFCLGDETTKWGLVRIAMGHKEPFSLKYVGIGNEQWQREYHEHYEAFVAAFEKAAKENPALYGDIELIVANGTASGSTEGWGYIEDYPDSITTLVDEHYYQTPEWYFSNNKRYDSYDRDAQADVFLGEYAAKSNTLLAALAEASYMTGIERNADVVKMACYAPLFGNSTMNQWTPDMIFFSNDNALLTANYYVQKMFANNVGTNILPTTLTKPEIPTADNTLSGKVGLGSWMTSVAYDNLKVVSNDTGDVLYETDFSSDKTFAEDDWTNHEGNWTVKDGRLLQTNTGSPADTNTGDAVYVGDAEWTNYTLTVDAEILSGQEGFLIPICVKNTANNIFWNIGGWGNTVSCLQIVEKNVKSDQVTGTVKNIKLKKNTVYELKVVVNGDNIKCYIDNTLYVDYTKQAPEPVYETTSIDENGDIIIKFVNTTEHWVDMNITLDNIDMSNYETTAPVTTLSSGETTDENSFKEPDKIVPVESTVSVSDNFCYQLPEYSVTIIRIPCKK